MFVLEVHIDLPVKNLENLYTIKKKEADKIKVYCTYVSPSKLHRINI